jgi:hypothetical protein
MVIVCKGICKKFRVKRSHGRHHYLQGQKRCQYCSVYVETNLNKCPCCHLRLRLSPRATKNKHSFLSKMQVLGSSSIKSTIFISVYINIYTYEQRLKHLSASNLTKGKRKRVNKHCRGMQSSSNCTWTERGPII